MTKRIKINNEVIKIDFNETQTVCIHRFSKHHKTPIILDITRESWAGNVIEDVCKYDYWEWSDSEVIEDWIEVFRTNDDFDEEAYRNAHDRDGIYFDNEFVFNPYIDNSIQVDDVIDTTFYNNLIELIEDNSNNENLLNAVKNYLNIAKIN